MASMTSERTGTPAAGRRSRIVASIVLAIALGAGALPMLGFLLPATVDLATESIEPLQTFRFFLSHGTVYDPWGPVPHFLYALPYGALLALWRASGQWVSSSFDYPYGFSAPHEQLGTLLLSARIVGLLVTALSAWFLMRSLARATGSNFWACAAMCLFVAGSPEVLVALSSTKPDCLMMALSMVALKAYVDQIHRGATAKTMALLAVSCVASLSCKELTGPLAVCLCAAAVVMRHPQDELKLPARLGHLAGWGLVSYALLNVVYAPQAWAERMQIVLFGKLKDTEIWASSNQSLGSYLWDSVNSAVAVLGAPAGLALLWAALLGGPRGLLKRWACWWPLSSYIVCVVVIAGYMPTYFLLPMAPLAAVAMALGLGLSGAQANRPLVRGLISVLVVLQLGSAWWYGQAHRSWHPQSLTEAYLAQRDSCLSGVARINLWGAAPGSSRLSYLGYPADERPLATLLAEPGGPPEVLLVDQDHWTWVGDIPKLPARAAMVLEETGLDYSAGVHLEDYGYHLVQRLSGQELCSWLLLLQPMGLLLDKNPLLVFERPLMAASSSRALSQEGNPAAGLQERH